MTHDLVAHSGLTTFEILKYKNSNVLFMTFYNLEHPSEEAFPGKSYVDCIFLKLNSNYQDKLITPLSSL